jgi:hypothetical protein
MALRTLSSWLTGHASGQEHSKDGLTWILLSPVIDEDLLLFGNQYSPTVNKVVEAIEALEDVDDVVRLVNVRPSSALHKSTASILTSTSSQESLLIHTCGSDPATVVQIHALLDSMADVHHNSSRPIFRWSLNAYELVQTYEPRSSRGVSGTCVVTVAIEPGQFQQFEVDSWYREEQLSLLGAHSPGLFLRCRRYRRLDVSSKADHGDDITELLAIHEYVSVNALFKHSIEQGPVVEETSRSKKVLESATSVERTVWHGR